MHTDGPRGIVSTCLCVLRLLVQSGTGIPWVVQSVRWGLLAALVNIAPEIHVLDGEFALAPTFALVHDVLPRYLLFRPVIKAVARALAQLKDGPKITLTRFRALGESWPALKTLSKERLLYYQSLFVIGCEKCAEQGHRTAFRRCSRCRDVFYCSVACQVADWTDRHKARCSPWHPPPVHFDGLLSDHEQRFHTQWLMYQAQALAASIVALAGYAPPGTCQYLFSLVIHVDCTVNPVQLRLVESPRNDQDAGKGVRVQGGVQLGHQVHCVQTFLPNKVLTRDKATMIDYVLDNIPVEYGAILYT
ncbi:hypothetical protein FA95DRAFT_535513 [Auriscalpium vulgare]|uniref:Uncharacterized protein n=1 Tax=Auriscalpium vulgare TaxID=40419 RepID=A0ACB8REU2_9AGAM|nr:hypothetical protein FA95DRAFT_535513 [Auriscalpium vulgare]